MSIFAGTNTAGRRLDERLQNGLMVGEVENIARGLLASKGIAAPSTTGRGELSAAIEAAGLNSAFDTGVKSRAALQASATSRVNAASTQTSQNVANGIFNTGRSEQAQTDARQMDILRGMDGYYNETTGHTFNYENYLRGIDTAYGEEEAGNVNRGLISTQASDTYTKARETANLERGGALIRPKKFDWAGLIGTALITGGVGFGAGALAGPYVGAVTPKMAASGFKALGSLPR